MTTLPMPDDDDTPPQPAATAPAADPAATAAPVEIVVAPEPPAAAEATEGAEGTEAAAGAAAAGVEADAEAVAVAVALDEPASALPAGAPAAPTVPAPPELSPAACAARLAELFPALFGPGQPPGAIKPMKLRIQVDIQQRTPGVFSRRMLGIFFSRYTTTNAYLKALTAAPHRFDLDGQPAGEISAEHRALAAEELARRHALAAERRAAMRPAPQRAVPASVGPAVADAPHEPRGPRAERPAGRWRDDRPAQRPPRAQRDGAARPARDAGPAPAQAASQSPREVERPMPSARAEPPPARDAAPAPAQVQDPAQRERATLLRTFESSPLSKANFCALKGITEAALDTALTLARQERPERPPQPPQGLGPDEAPRHDRRDERPRTPHAPGRGPRSGTPPKPQR